MRRLVWFALVCAAVARLSAAHQLPVRLYTTADGLLHNRANCIVQDSRGFLWFCTAAGLSRFDGYAFAALGPEHGLPDRSILVLKQIRDGSYWIGTNGAGLYVLRPEAARSARFEHVPLGSSARSQFILAILEDRDGRLWVGTEDGLYASDRAPPPAGPVPLRQIPIGVDEPSVEVLLQDHTGALWIGAASWRDAAESGLIRRGANGEIRRFGPPDRLVRRRITSLIEDRHQHIWAGSWEGGVSLIAYDHSGIPRIERSYLLRHPPEVGRVADLLESADGTIWIGGEGLSEFLPERAQEADPFRHYRQSEGLVENGVTALAEDRDGNLWAATESSGVMKITRHGFVRFDERDGLGHSRIRAIFENPAGDLRVISQQILINHFDGARFTAVMPNVPRWIKPDTIGWGWKQTVLEDRTGDWWVPTARGLLRFGKPHRFEDLASQAPKAVYTSHNGLTHDEVFRVFEDAHQDIWISVLGGAPALIQWRRSTGDFRAYGEADGIPDRPDQGGAPTVFREDGAGQLWIGFGAGGIARRRGGRFEIFGAAQGLPSGGVTDLHVDRMGRLWIATSRGGIGRMDDPRAEHPQIVSIGKADGLSNNNVSCLAEDRWGRIYAGTARGLDRIEFNPPAALFIRHYTTADGLPPGECTSALGTRDGAVWIGTLQGLSMFRPEPDRPRPSLPVWISGVRIRGVPRPISDLGETHVANAEIEAFQNHVAVDFFGIGLQPGENLRYQYRLEGADRDWSPPVEQRTVNYSNLAPGSYRFLVRAIDSDGVASVSPATFEFHIAPPLWGRWWVQVLGTALLAGLLYAVQRYRTARLVALERVRTRIASDLHDEIGSGLSQVAILSEVACEHLQRDSAAARETAREIAATARSMVDGMSDIVWSIDPRHDDLSSLLRRINKFGSEILEPQSVAWVFQSPDHLDRVKLTPEQRRNIYLVLKEAVNNAAKHARARQVALTIRVPGRCLEAEILDDGVGFDTQADPHGYGLTTMRERAKQLRGELHLRSAAGKGLAVTLRVPL